VAIRPSTVPTATVESSATSMDARVPLAGAGISVSTLSVEISRMGSSAATVSPTS
jgi:K+-transporting ATPase c subunit